MVERGCSSVGAEGEKLIEACGRLEGGVWGTVGKCSFLSRFQHLDSSSRCHVVYLWTFIISILPCTISLWKSVPLDITEAKNSAGFQKDWTFIWLTKKSRATVTRIRKH